jgi:nitroimidazol reductase NimA-like FMN-containing flavoprotein (pyridoxamine 5'-phosphate oxidase superfamily)
MENIQEQSMTEKLQIYDRILCSDTFANVSSIMKDGSPHITPVWYDYNKNTQIFKITVFEDSQKDKNFKRNKSIALSIVDKKNPYCYIQIQGKIVSNEYDKNNEFSNYLTNKYSKGKQSTYLHTGSNIIIYSVKPEKISGWKPSSADQFHTWMIE